MSSPYVYPSDTYSSSLAARYSPDHTQAGEEHQRLDRQAQYLQQLILDLTATVEHLAEDLGTALAPRPVEIGDWLAVEPEHPQRFEVFHSKTSGLRIGVGQTTTVCELHDGCTVATPADTVIVAESFDSVMSALVEPDTSLPMECSRCRRVLTDEQVARGYCPGCQAAS